MEVGSQLQATGRKNSDTHSVGGCVGPKANLDGFREENISKNSKKFPYVFNTV